MNILRGGKVVNARIRGGGEARRWKNQKTKNENQNSSIRKGIVAGNVGAGKLKSMAVDIKE